MMNNLYTHRTYYTLEDAGIGVTQLKTYCKEPESETTAEFLRLFLLAYCDNWFIYTDVETPAWEEPAEPVIDETKKSVWLKKFSYLYNGTYDKYAKLIELYNSQKDTLMKKLEHTSELRNLDTPEIDQGQSDLNIDSYTTNLARTVESADPADVMFRLKNIQENYMNIYKSWIKEFVRLFGEEVA